jgi:hypothetical protein
MKATTLNLLWCGGVKLRRSSCAPWTAASCCCSSDAALHCTVCVRVRATTTTTQRLLSCNEHQHLLKVNQASATAKVTCIERCEFCFAPLSETTSTAAAATTMHMFLLCLAVLPPSKRVAATLATDLHMALKQALVSTCSQGAKLSYFPKSHPTVVTP